MQKQHCLLCNSLSQRLTESGIILGFEAQLDNFMAINNIDSYAVYNESNLFLRFSQKPVHRQIRKEPPLPPMLSIALRYKALLETGWPAWYTEVLICSGKSYSPMSKDKLWFRIL